MLLLSSDTESARHPLEGAGNITSRNEVTLATQNFFCLQDVVGGSPRRARPRVQSLYCPPREKCMAWLDGRQQSMGPPVQN